MKRIFAFTVLVLSLVGCELTHPSNTEVTSSELTFYTSSQFGKCIVTPAELVSAVIDFDKYLNMSEEEMILDENIYGLANYLGENSYRFSHHHISVSCTVNTDGKSILEPGTVWTFSQIGYFGYYGDTTIGMSYDVNIYDESTLEMVADSTWIFKTKGQETTIRMIKSDVPQCWDIVCEGSEDGDNGLKSISKTGSDGFKMWCTKQNIDEKYSSRTMSFSGVFSTAIFKDEELLDYCTFAMRPGFNATITTSRD